MNCSLTKKTFHSICKSRHDKKANNAPRRLLTGPRDVCQHSHVLTPSVCSDVIHFLEGLSDDCYHRLFSKQWRKETKRMGQLCYGRKSKNEAEIPKIFADVGEIVSDYFRTHYPYSKLAGMTMETLTVQRYRPGEGLGAHRDPARPDPLVVGVTLCADTNYLRTLRFRPVNGAGFFDVPTPSGSVYTFHGDAYNEWKHESVPSQKQRSNVYSLTYREQAPPGPRTSAYATGCAVYPDPYAAKQDS